jgi:hypothetical protein
MPLTYRCELRTNSDLYKTTECRNDEEGYGCCGDENILHDCLWGMWTTKSDEEFKEYIRRQDMKLGMNYE